MVNKTAKVNIAVMLSAVLIGGVVWVLHAWLDAVIFYNISFLDTLIFKVTPHDLFVRIMMFIGFILFGLIMSGYM